MKPGKDYEYYLHHDPCKVCVCCDNQYVESDDYPCSICHNFSEFIPSGGESPVESNWLNDIIEFQEVLDLVDNITEKIFLLDEKVPGIAQHAEELLTYLRAMKTSGADAWLIGEDYGGPCYDGQTLISCGECPKDTCPYKGER